MTEISHETDFISDLVNRMNIWTYLPRRFASPWQPLGATSSNPPRHKHSSFTGTRLLEKKQVISLHGNSQPSQRRAVTSLSRGTNKQGGGHPALVGWWDWLVRSSVKPQSLCSSYNQILNCGMPLGLIRVFTMDSTTMTLWVQTSTDDSCRRPFYFVRQPRSSIRRHFLFPPKTSVFIEFDQSCQPLNKHFTYRSFLKPTKLHSGLCYTWLLTRSIAYSWKSVSHSSPVGTFSSCLQNSCWIKEHAR